MDFIHIRTLLCTGLPVLLVEAAVKSIVIFTLTFIITRLLRKSSSTARHLMWSVALAAMLFLPVIGLIVPAWHLSWIPQWMVQTTTDQAIQTVQQDELAESIHETATRNTSLPSTSTANLESAPDRSGVERTEQSVSILGWISQLHWQFTLVILWFSGLAFMVIRYLVGRIVVWRMALRALPMTESVWLKLTENIQEQYGIKRTIRFFWSDKTPMPMTWGIRKPHVILPLEAKTWPADRKRFIVLHELAHIKRWDALTQLMAQWAGAVYWFHPLIWVAKRQCLKEREHACDDWVLVNGSTASEYAGLLLDIAKALPALPLGSLATVSMARRSQLEGRLLAILSTHRQRHGWTRPNNVVTAIVFSLLIIPLAMLKPASSASSMVFKMGDLPNTFNINSGSPAFRNKSDDAGLNIIEKVPDSEDSNIISEIKEGRKNDNPDRSKQDRPEKMKQPVTYTKPNPVIKSLCTALSDKDLDVRVQAAQTLGRMENREATSALIGALKDDQWQMRLAVIDALEDINDPRALPAYIEALKDEHWQVRSYAADAIGTLKDMRGIDALLTALQDEHRDVKREAIESLGEIKDRSAVPALKQALLDEDWEIRYSAAEALGDLKAPEAADAIRLVLKDPHPEVRKAAVEALDNINDYQSTPHLIEALKDESSDIRKAAVEALGDLEDPVAIKPLTTMLDDADMDVRKAAIIALGQMEDSRVLEPLSRALSDDDWVIRYAAAEALGHIDQRGSVDALIKALNDTNVDVLRAVVETLGDLRDQRACTSLIPFLSHSDWRLRKETAEALGDIGDPSSARALIPCLQDTQREVKLDVIGALGSLENREAVDALIQALSDSDWEVREKAVEALGDIGDPRAVDALSRLLKDPNESVRKEAAKALGDIGWDGN